MVLESKKIKAVTVSTVSPSICHEVMGPDTMILDWIMPLPQNVSLLLARIGEYVTSQAQRDFADTLKYAYLQMGR